MAEESAKLRIPYIAAAQAQKHVTHNEAMTLLDTLVQLSVLDKDLSTPPSEPEEGDTYIVAESATDAWEGWDNRIARYIDGTWRSYLPGMGAGAGWLAYVLDEALLYRFDGTEWAPAFDSFVPNAVVNAIADRADHNGEAANFSVLVTEDSGNEGKPTLYFKLSGSSADWSAGITWLPVGGEVATIEPEGAWSSEATYAARDAVSYQGSSYVSRVDDNTDNQPDESPGEWMLLAEKGEIVNLVPEGEWAGGTAYATGDAVSYEGSSYLSRVDDNTGNQPDESPTQWMLLAEKGEDGEGGGGGASGFFHVDKNGTDQTGIASGTDTLVTWARELADEDNIFDLGTEGVTPSAGTWLFEVKLRYSLNVVDQQNYSIALYADSGGGPALVVFADTVLASGTANVFPQATFLVQANGTTTYYIYARGTGAGDKTVHGATSGTFWKGVKLG